MINRYVFVLAAMSGVVSGTGFADSPKLVQAPVEKVFVPQGFDDNDKVEVVVHGHFTSSCYKMGPVNSTVDKANKKILVHAQAYYYPQAVCTQMVVPFIKSVELNEHLPSGNYKVEVINRPAAKTTALVVAKATRPEADDYLYAAVQSATIEEKTNGEREIILKGQHPFVFQGCVKFSEVKATVGTSGVIVIQPITHIELDESLCAGSVNNRFEFRKSINKAFPSGEYLMHVRVLDGNAINQFVDFE